MNLQVIIVFLLLGNFTIGTCQIIKGTDTLKFDHAIVIGKTHSVAYTTTSKLQITTSPNAFDLFVQVTGCTLCMGCCCSYVIASSRPFYFSKKESVKFDFSKEINLVDTTNFYYLDTTSGPKYSSGIEYYFPKLDGQEGLGVNLYNAIKSNFIIVKNAENKFILIKMQTISDFNPINPINSCPYGIIVNWQIQNNGSIFFDSPTNIKKRNTRINQKKSAH